MTGANVYTPAIWPPLVAGLNPAAARMLSVSEAGARGKTLPELLPALPDLCALLTDAADSVAAPGPRQKAPYATEISLGTGPHVGLYALEFSALEDFRGLFMGHLLMLRDVTERRVGLPAQAPGCRGFLHLPRGATGRPSAFLARPGGEDPAGILPPVATERNWAAAVPPRRAACMKRQDRKPRPEKNSLSSA